MRAGRRLLANIGSCRRGTSVIELAIIAPVLVMLVLAASDIAMAYRMKLKLQAAAERTAQMASSGGLNSDAYQNLAADAASAAGVSATNVTVTSTVLCDGTAQSSTTATCPAGQQMKRYVALTISGSYSPMFGYLTGNGTRFTTDNVPLTGFASVRLQ